MKLNAFFVKLPIVSVMLLFFTDATPVIASISLNGGGLTIVEEGGPIDIGNLADPSTGAVAFGTPSYVSGSSYSIPHINDQLLGHRKSWFASTPSATLGKGFAGIAFTSLQDISGIAFGRDSNQEYLDARCEGEYTLQYTTVANPDETTPDAYWTNIGTLNYEWLDSDPFAAPCTCLSTRHRFSFDSVQATGVRLVVPYTYSQSSSFGTIVEEIEVYNAAYVPRGPALTGSLALVEEGGTATSGNLAAASKGSVAFSTGEFVEGGYAYQTINVNDGDYGDDTAWVGVSASHRDPSFVGINFKGAIAINSIAFGRDNDGLSSDRYIGEYKLYYTTVPNPDENTFDWDWYEIGTINYSSGGATGFTDPTLRHRYSFDEVTATGIRLGVPATCGGLDQASTLAATCIDELEVYGPIGDTLCSGDANVDGKVDYLDAEILAENWLATDASWFMGDFNHDYVVDDIDATILASNWHYGVGGAVPEPSSIVILLAGLLSLACLWQKEVLL